MKTRVIEVGEIAAEWEVGRERERERSGVRGFRRTRGVGKCREEIKVLMIET